MADQRKRLEANVTGNFFVDRTCINCDTCRQLAPNTFEEVGDYSAVVRQPKSAEQNRRAYQALLACPVGSIGTAQNDKRMLQEAKESFPLPIEEQVFYCGFNSEKSFGANSFFVQHPDGNWMIDAPRYLKPLAEAFERLGGLAFIFLTHEDDVADADKYAAHFGAQRIIHRADAHALPLAERVLDGTEMIHLAPDFMAIPVPGHTEGSQALLYRDTFLFTGDHLWWEPAARQLGAPRQLVWNHDRLVQSLEKLLGYRFEWVLAGHGDRVRLSVDDMRTHMRHLIKRRTTVAVS